MKGFIQTAFLFLALAGAVPCQGRTSLTQEDFEILLQEIHHLNTLDPAQAAAIVEPAEAFVSRRPSLENRIRLAVARAPLDSMESGYREARHRLIAFLGESESSGKGEFLTPLLRYGLSDLAYRNGEYLYSLRQLLGAVRSVTGSTPPWLKDRLLEAAVKVNMAAGFSGFSLRCLDSWRQFGNPGTTESLVLEAEIRWLDRDFKGANRRLEAASASFGEETSPFLISRFWTERVWLSLRENTYLQAEEFLASAKDPFSGEPPSILQADILFLESLILLKEGPGSHDEVRGKLDQARRFYAGAGCPARFTQMLHRACFLYESVYFKTVDLPLLEEMSRHAHDESNLRAQAKGLAARAQLALQNEVVDSQHHATSIRNSLRYNTRFMLKMADLQMEWMDLHPRLATSQSHAWKSLLFYYSLIFVLILVIVLLAMTLRIRGQRHLNQRLAEAVRKARIAEQAAEESNRLKTRFLANISHEIKTPMSGLVGMASLLDELITDPTQRKYLSTIRICSENLLVLVNDLLDLGRMDSGKLEIEAASFEVPKMLDYCLDVVRGNADKKGLDLRLVTAPDLPQTLEGDATRIGQVITNLLNNAVKFTDSGMVALKVEFEKTLGSSGNLKVTVEDTGIGIPEGKLHSVFEPFSQERSYTGRKYEGSGLGLAICLKLVELMGGSISVESKVGQGSSFHVILPVEC